MKADPAMEHRRIIKQGSMVVATHEDGSIDPAGTFTQGLFVGTRIYRTGLYRVIAGDVAAHLIDRLSVPIIVVPALLALNQRAQPSTAEAAAPVPAGVPAVALTSRSAPAADSAMLTTPTQDQAGG